MFGAGIAENQRCLGNRGHGRVGDSFGDMPRICGQQIGLHGVAVIAAGSDGICTGVHEHCGKPVGVRCPQTATGDAKTRHLERLHGPGDIELVGHHAPSGPLVPGSAPRIADHDNPHIVQFAP